MDSIMQWARDLSLVESFWIFTLFFVIHEFEEWNIADFEGRHFSNLPPTHSSRNARAWIGVVCAIALVWVAAASIPGLPAAYIFLPAVYVAILNALQHFYWSVRFRTPASGVVSAAFLIVPAGLYLVWRSLAEGHVASWYAASLASVIVVGLWGTIRSGRVAPPILAAIYGIGGCAVRLFQGKKAG